MESPINRTDFRRILARNIGLPLVAGLVNSVVFVGLVFVLLSVSKMADRSEWVISQAGKLAIISLDMQSGLRGYLITNDESFLEPYKLGKAEFDQVAVELASALANNPQQAERLRRLTLMQQEWNDYAQTVMELRRTNGPYQELVATRGKRESEEVRREKRAFQDAERQVLREHTDRIRMLTVSAIIGYLLISFGITGLLAYLGRRELLQLSTTYNASLEEREQYTQVLEHQSWQRSGQALLAERSMGRLALPLLGRTVLDFLARYVNAGIAVMYVREKQGGMLRRVAAFGISHDDTSTPQTFERGEGLVEQAFFSNKLIQLNDVPSDYLKVNTGLGSAPPRHILLLPISHDGDGNGVIELGFLQAPSAQALEFLQLVASNIGNTIEAALYRLKLQDALEETQQLNEELQVQQEELRTSNEELEVQSRVLQESQALLENQKAELEQTNEKLIEQALVLDQKNEILNEIQQQLETRATELQRASRYKSEFLANMSHELRTPLNSSMILAKLLGENAKGNLDSEQVKFAQSIYSAGNDLLNLINDILDISRVEAGKLDLRAEKIDIQRLINDLGLTFTPLTNQKNLLLKMQMAPATAPTIVTDRQRLEQILKNLLSNACKFTDAGKVELAVANTPDGSFAFSVSDSGIGISEDQQQIIFEAFQQADGSINRRFGGTGLGLSISRDLAVLMGGSIQVRSKLGSGSTFTLILPATLILPTTLILPAETPLTDHHQPVTNSAQIVAQPSRAAGRVAESEPTHHFPDDRGNLVEGARRVLVIEDDVSFAKILYDLAHELRYSCLVASTASEGLQLAEDLTPHAILLDLGLPDVSGLSVLQKLKLNSITRHIPVHIVSSNDRTEAALQLGAVGYMVKPTTRENLQEMFKKIEAKLTQKFKRVLLVEDDALQRESIMRLIGEEDIEITAVEYGNEALKLLRDTLFDCMIIDLKLPDMQGHDLLRRMSEENICSFPPVIVYTGRNLTRDEEHELLKYSRSIIIKGARSPERLLDEVTLFLHKVESQLSNDRQNMLRKVRNRDKAMEGRRILLVDDDMRNIFALTGALEQKGALVEVARNGFEAIEKLDKVADIDLVLMDIMMPGMDGLEATRRIRADGRFQDLPIIAVTAKAMKDDQEQCMKAGASDYMAKPIDVDRLYSLLRIWMPSLERL
jgi:CheY-like chemotaxis protein/CHASE3 domain sensor protein